MMDVKNMTCEYEIFGQCIHQQTTDALIIAKTIDSNVERPSCNQNKSRGVCPLKLTGE